jgi:hypothetical protein
MRNAQKMFFGKSEGSRQLGRLVVNKIVILN